MTDQAVQPETQNTGAEYTASDEPRARIGGGWKLSEELLAGEETAMKADVLHKPSITNKGGLLYLTNKRVLYLPDRWSAICGEQKLISAVASVGPFGLISKSDGPLFHDGNLLAFHGFYITFGSQRHVFTTRLRMTDQEWIDAIAKASGKSPENQRDA
jgi:hypothetical protein